MNRRDRDIVDAAVDIALGLISIACVTFVCAVFLALCAGCVPLHTATLPPQTEFEQRIAAAGLEAWRAAGLPTTPAVNSIQRLRIVRVEDPAAYSQMCPDSWACLGWAEQGDVAVAYLSPALPEGNVPHAALHEVCHALGYRTSRWSDWYDYRHADPRVWAGKGGSRPDSVEQRAQRALDGPDIGERVTPASQRDE